MSKQHDSKTCLSFCQTKWSKRTTPVLYPHCPLSRIRWATVSYPAGPEKCIFKTIRCLNFRHPSNYGGYSRCEKIARWRVISCRYPTAFPTCHMSHHRRRRCHTQYSGPNYRSLPFLPVRHGWGNITRVKQLIHTNTVTLNFTCCSKTRRIYPKPQNIQDPPHYWPQNRRT